MEAFRRAIYVQARSLHDGRSINRKSRSAGLLEWLGDDIPGETTLRPLGANVGDAATRPLFVNDVPKPKLTAFGLYQRF